MDDGAEKETNGELEELIKDAFGESSEEEEVKEADDPTGGQMKTSGDSLFPSWEKFNEIKGLFLCKDFLSADQQSKLLSEINQEGWFGAGSKSGNQAMRFGNLPKWAVELSDTIREVVYLSSDISELADVDAEDCDNEMKLGLFPSVILWRQPLFNQLIVNKYEPGEGIRSHVDLERFQDGIAIVSLESSCVMHFTPDDRKNKDNPKIPLLLTPGSLVMMWGEARYLWKHEINRAPGFQTWEGQEIPQKRRISITLRKMR